MDIYIRLVIKLLVHLALGAGNLQPTHGYSNLLVGLPSGVFWSTEGGVVAVYQFDK